MSNELPPRPTEMCEPVIRGEMVASDVYYFYINNKLNKAIDDYWQSKYKTFAKGRIKRMRANKKKYKGYLRYLNLGIKHWKTKRLYFNHGTITRWNRH